MRKDTATGAPEIVNIPQEIDILPPELVINLP